MRNAALAMIVVSSFAASATAGPRATIIVTQDAPTVTIHVSQADFVSARARTQLDRRIRAAIETVCGSYATIETDQVPEMDTCWSIAHAQAARQLPVAQAQATASLTLAAR